ncbi:MAG: UvrD-helicase domain-containing protein, partial [Lachnospiraceae bacterium]|nr:UvrD-helicase domain-containing protein [Lachnospiraceae bacterium]
MINKEEILRNLNGEQRKAVLTTEGPVLILAGAGSGKTRVLVHRTAYLIDSGKALPGNILAITFTNKAANEMRERVDSMVGFGSRDIHVSTFHSLCVRILRYDADRLGYGRSFSIYDSDDQLSLMKQIMKDRNMDPKRVNPKAVLGSISSAKNELINNEKYRKLSNSFYGENVSDLYDAYQKALRSNNAMDFDDLIMNTVDLFERFPEVLDIYRERFRYMMVDEYQDTNSAQFRLVSLMAGKYRNLCVVGDDDQSIYRFRGANIRNILDFEKVFPDAAVIRLEQNYRSTKNILDAAYGVISNNDSRKEKRLWTENVTGEKIRLKEYPTGFDEAEGICREISDLVGRKERSYRDFAILYRTNAQSRLFEEKFLMANVPYRIVGGINFYARKEIRDMLAYLKTVDNASDDLMVIRVINTPRRGIGDSTIEKVSHFAGAEGISFYQAACCANDIPGLSKATAKKVAQFADLIGILRAYAEEGSVSGLLKKTAELTGYTAELEREGTEEARGRLENLDELISKAVQYEKNAPDPTLSGFLEDVALIAEVENTEDGG